MGVLNKFRNWLLGDAQTASYKQFSQHAFIQLRDLPIFTFDTIRAMHFDPTIRLGLAMRAAPLAQAQFAFKRGDKWVEGIKADSPEVGRFVFDQLRRIWKHELHKLLTSQVWGWSACEVTYRFTNNMIEVDTFLHRQARDVRALLKDGEVHGVQFDRIRKVGSVQLRFPRSIWHAYNAEAESPYGQSILKGAYSPWADKWLNGGALDVRRLFMHKDAYGGTDLTYPPGTTNVDGKGQVPNRDIAREIAEQLKAGGVTTRPAQFQDGKPLWEITRATVPSNPSHILEYPKDLDTEMLRGMEIPDDVITAEATGAWQGKQVPMQAFYTSADQWLTQIVRTIVVQILEPLVLLNFGEAAEFQVETKPLAEQVMEQLKGDDSGQGEEEQPGQRRFSLERSVGEGVVQASHLVQAGREFLANGRYRFASECGATGGPGPRGGGGFSKKNTCWNLTGKHRERLAELQREREAKEEAERKQRQTDERQAQRKAKAKEAQFKRTQMFRDITATLGTDDPEIVRDFRGLMEDLHKVEKDAAEEYNSTYDEIVDQLLGTDAAGRRNRGAFVSRIRRAEDPTKIPRFDETVQFVRDNPAAQQILAANVGESTGSGDVEALVFEGLRAGKREVPGLNSQEVWDKALEYLETIDPVGAAGDFPDEINEEAVPFSLNGKRKRFAQSPAGGTTIGGVFYPGGQFIPSQAIEKAQEAYAAHVQRRQDRGQHPLSREQWEKALRFERIVFEDNQSERDEDEHSDWLDDEQRQKVLRSNRRLAALERQAEQEAEAWIRDHPDSDDPPPYTELERKVDTEIVKAIQKAGGTVPDGVLRHVGATT